MTPIIVDAHEDLAWNMLTFGRDYTRSALETRRLEVNNPSAQQNGECLIGWPEYQQGNIAIVFSTLFVTPIRRVTAEWDSNQTYATFDEARQRYLEQLTAYRRLTDQHPDKFRLLRTRSELESHLALWEKPTEKQNRPVGLVFLMEGAEGVRTPDELGEWWELGLRIIGPAWAGTRFCGGTRDPGPLTKDGYALLEAMSQIGFTLDLSHMDRQAALQALDTYDGSMIASHANPLALLKGSESNRHLSDEVIDGIFQRNGVIGIVPTNQFMKPGWKDGDGREGFSLENVANSLDYYCQRAGDALHVGFGTDYDGGFGLRHAPTDLDTIADLQKLVPILEARGYQPSDIAAIFGGNWIEHLRKSLPA
jgi:membrane dipeptidase